jgi:FixJ family two-component response regulator
VAAVLADLGSGAMSQRDRDRDLQPSEANQAPLIAIVDDDASVRQSMSRLIRPFGYRTETFASGEEFLGSAFIAKVACLLLDIRMPGMDGFEVQRRLHESGSRVPIVFLTARASEDEERRARDAGAVAFLRKPIAQALLLQALENVVRPDESLGGGGDDE